MPRRSILSAAERDSLIALPESQDELIRRYTFSETDLSIIRQHRGAENRLGFAVQLCYMRYPGIILGIDESPFSPLLAIVAQQLKVSVAICIIRLETSNFFINLRSIKFKLLVGI